MSSLFEFAGGVALYVALYLGVRAAWKSRDMRRADVAAFLVMLWLPTQLPQAAGWSSLRTALLSLEVFFILRLVQHFRAVPRSAMYASVVISAALGSAEFVGYGQVVSASRVGFAALGIGVAAAAFVLEARRSSGVKGKRLLIAGAGAGSFSVGFAIACAGISLSSPIELDRLLAWWVRQLESAGTICFFFAFTPPQGLISRWRRAEHAEYIGRSAEREPEERGWLAAQDLVAGASRTVGGAVAFVARTTEKGPGLSVVAANDPALLGWGLPDDDLIARSLREDTPTLGRTATCAPDVAARLAPYGSLVLAAPLVLAGGQGAGVVVAVHRKGALFPEDDLTSLAQMARSAAIALDHAALVRQRRIEAQEVANRRLRELESRVGVMVDSIRDYAMLVVDSTGVIAAWHLGAEQLFGYSRDSIARRSAGALFGVTATDMRVWLEDASRSGVVEREGECHRADGTRFIGVTTIRPLVPETGLPPGFVIVTHDVTEQRRLEDRVRQGQKMEAIGTLASGVAHDFNNILAAIIGHADWLEEDMAGDARLEQVVEIQRAAERGVDMTQQLLAFGRREALKPVAIDLGAQVRGMMPMLRRLIHGRVEIIDATTPDLAPIRGSRTQVEQIVLNLAVNARDAMPTGGQLTFRTIEASLDGDSRAAGAHADHVLLEVSDTGVGMDAETRRRMFEPFFTTKDVGQGTGLGLATVYGIVQDMHGLIDVESEPGRGSTFRVYFPRAGEVARAEAAAAVAPAAGADSILLIEDDASLRGYLRHVLEERGYSVLEANGPQAALDLVDRHAPSIRLVVSDVAMAGMTGPTLVTELARRQPNLAVVFISGHGESESVRLGMPPGSRWLQKPFSPADLIDEVERVLAPA